MGATVMRDATGLEMPLTYGKIDLKPTTQVEQGEVPSASEPPASGSAEHDDEAHGVESDA